MTILFISILLFLFFNILLLMLIISLFGFFTLFSWFYQTTTIYFGNGFHIIVEIDSIPYFSFYRVPYNSIILKLFLVIIIIINLSIIVAINLLTIIIIKLLYSHFFIIVRPISLTESRINNRPITSNSIRQDPF